MGQNRGNSNNNNAKGGKSKGGGRGRDFAPAQPEFDEKIIDIARVAKVIKGGRRFAFRVSVVVGDNKGKVGIGIGKARTVPDAIRKAIEIAKRNMTSVSMVGTTVPHEVVGKHGAARVMLKLHLLERV